MSGACEYKPQFDNSTMEKENKKLEILRLAGVASVTVIIAWLRLLQPLWLADAIIVLTVIIGGYPLFKESFYALKKGRVSMELSMVIAIVAALALSQFLPAIVITFFALLSEFVEGFIVKKGRKNIQTLYDLAPRKAIVKRRGGQVGTVEVNEVKVGDIVIVREGDVIPVDGQVVNGTSLVDQSTITGESIPIEKSVGDSIFAGTINQTQQLEVRCDRLSTDTTFARIIHLVEEAEASKAPIQKLSDKMATRLIQFAIGLSVLTYIVTQNIVSTLSVIVVAGACGLAVGTPIALLATTGKLSKRGIIVKGGLQIENLKRTGTIVFDKTGTLTYGKPIVSQVISIDPNIDPKKVLEYAAIAERNVNHPLAKAIGEKAHQEKIVISSSSIDSRNLVTIGRGVAGVYDGRKISIGNIRFMEETIPSIRNSSFYDNSSPQKLSLRNDSYLYLVEVDDAEDKTYDEENELLASSTTAYVALDDKIIGAVLFKDALRKESREAISKIKSMGIRTIMLTGDNEKIARQIAQEADIDEYYANLLPQDKVFKIEELVKTNRGDKAKGIVVMVGDGINDAPALAKADVGIAMGKTGTDVAIETADVVLMTENLLRIPYLIKSSRQSILAIRENFFGTLSVDGIGFVLAATGNLNPLIAAFIHIASELVFMANSARLIMDNEKSGGLKLWLT